MSNKTSKTMQNTNQGLYLRIAEIIESAREHVATVANTALVYTYYEIGRMIVEDEQAGRTRAGYGEKLLRELSVRLTERFGKGWSSENLKLMRRFFLEYSNLVNTVYPIDPKNESAILTKDTTTKPLPNFTLSWSHYIILMRISNRDERTFYERQAIEGQWSLRQLSRQIGSQLYERFIKHQGETNVKELMWKAPKPEVAEEPLKDPYTLEFLGLPERTDYSENQLEQAIIDHLQEFMLELGKGFTFVGRQVRLTIEEEHYKVDLVFYNRLTRSFFVFDLKLSKITHQDIGQMQMYVHYYDRVEKLQDENPTIGIILSSEEVNDATVKLTLPECEQDRIFARQYKTVLPSEATFKRFICSQRIAFENKAVLSSTARKSKKE